MTDAGVRVRSQVSLACSSLRAGTATIYPPGQHPSASLTGGLLSTTFASACRTGSPIVSCIFLTSAVRTDIQLDCNRVARNGTQWDTGTSSRGVNRRLVRGDFVRFSPVKLGMREFVNRRPWVRVPPPAPPRNYLGSRSPRFDLGCSATSVPTPAFPGATLEYSAPRQGCCEGRRRHVDLLIVLASCAVKDCAYDGDGVSPTQVLGICVLVLLVIGLAMVINRNTRQ
jgi:hypothetical protein